MSSATFAVTGATGGIGGRVARRLAEAGADQVLLLRDPARAPSLPRSRVVRGGYDLPAMRAGFSGIDSLFLVSAAEDANRIALHVGAVDAAVQAGVRRIVYLSFLGAAPDSTFTFARDHYATEEHIREAGVDYTFLRDSMYQDFLPRLADREGVIRGPAGDGRVSAITRADIADAAAAVLLDPGDRHFGRSYDLTGPAALSLGEVAAELTSVTGRTIRYHAETAAEAYASRASSGAPDFEVAGWVTSYLAIAAGELADVTDGVATLTGHPPMEFGEFLRREPGSWSHLIG
jgi:NAD(P)H dehydrogenase (quinone)